MLAAERDFAERKGRVGNRGRWLSLAVLQCGRAGDGRLSNHLWPVRRDGAMPYADKNGNQ
jgi:hypothetical protein